MTTVEAPPIRVTLPAAKKAVREVAKALPERFNPANMMVVRINGDVFVRLQDEPEENLEPGCIVGVVLAEKFGVPLSTLARVSGCTVHGLATLADEISFTDSALAYLDLAQQAADGRDTFSCGGAREWGVIPELVEAAA